MEIQDLGLSNKLPYIRSSTTKIIALVSVVVLLIAVNIFVVIYGRVQSKKENIKSKAGSAITNVSSEESGQISDTTVNIKDEEPAVALSNFFDLILENKTENAQKLISEYSSPALYQGFIDDILKYKESIGFSYVSLEYSRQKNFAYITVEISKAEAKYYHKFTMIKINSEWKIFNQEMI